MDNDADESNNESSSNDGDPFGEMKNEIKRRATFRPSLWLYWFLWGEFLAKIGFFYHEGSDLISCAFCGISFSANDQNNILLQMHMKSNSGCPLQLHSHIDVNAEHSNAVSEKTIPEFNVRRYLASYSQSTFVNCEPHSIDSNQRFALHSSTELPDSQLHVKQKVNHALQSSNGSSYGSFVNRVFEATSTSSEGGNCDDVNTRTINQIRNDSSILVTDILKRQNEEIQMYRHDMEKMKTELTDLRQIVTQLNHTITDLTNQCNFNELTANYSRTSPLQGAPTDNTVKKAMKMDQNDSSETTEAQKISPEITGQHDATSERQCRHQNRCISSTKIICKSQATSSFTNSGEDNCSTHAEPKTQETLLEKSVPNNFLTSTDARINSETEKPNSKISALTLRPNPIPALPCDPSTSAGTTLGEAERNLSSLGNNEVNSSASETISFSIPNAQQINTLSMNYCFKCWRRMANDLVFDSHKGKCG